MAKTPPQLASLMKRPRLRADRTSRARETFLKVLAETCNVSEACRQAKIGRQTVYDWKEADPAFSAAWMDAEETAVDKLEQVARDRAIDSSDRMLEILLKAHRPEKYVDRYRTEHTGRDGGPIEYRQLSDDEIAARIKAHEAARASQSAAE